MSKKNLSRSAIEGGRTGYSKNERYQSHRTERAITREYCGRAAVDDEYFDHTVIKSRKKVYKSFADKLEPMYRWLRSHVGQPWNDVRSKVHSMFDDRTISGQHILYDHLLSSVCQTGEYHHEHRWFDFVVDEGGILRLTETNRWNRRAKYRQKWDKYPGDWNRPNKDELSRWAANRQVIDYRSVQYWTAEATRMSWRICGHGYNCYCPHKEVKVQKTRRAWGATEWTNYEAIEQHCFSPVTPTSAQGKKFTKEEAEFWKKLHPELKEQLIYDKDKWKHR